MADERSGARGGRGGPVWGPRRSAGSLLLAAAVFGVLNTLFKPVLQLITLPVALVTFGIAWFFVSMLMLDLTRAIVSGFYINGFWTLVWATVIVWVVNMVLDFTPGPWQIAGKRGRINRRSHPPIAAKLPLSSRPRRRPRRRADRRRPAARCAQPCSSRLQQCVGRLRAGRAERAVHDEAGTAAMPSAAPMRSSSRTSAA